MNASPDSFALAWRLARREMRGGIRGFRVFMACLMLGVAAIAGVGSLADGVREGLRRDARTILGGDVELSFTHRSTSPEQAAFIAASGRVSQILEMRAMARTTDERALVELKAVDSAYPLVGEVRVGGAAGLAAAFARDAQGRWGAAVEPAALTRLATKIGGTIRIGEADFVVRATVESEPDRTANLFTLGPRVMIGREALAATELVQPGALIRYITRVVLAPGTDAAGWIETLKTRFPDAGWRIRGESEAAPGLQRWIDRIAMFLTLVGLTALLVGGVGVANAVRSYLDARTASIATIKCLGAPGRLVLRLYLLQILSMAAIGIGAGLAIGAAVPALAGPLLAERLGVEAGEGLHLPALALAAAFGMATAFAFALWPLARAREVPPAALFRDLVAPFRRWPRAVYIWASGAALVALAGLAIATSIDRKLGAAFCVAAVVCFAVFRLAAWLVSLAARRFGGVRNPALRLALANMHRPGSPTPGIVLSLGLGLTVLVLIAQVQGNFQRQLDEQLPQMAPSFFFIDIQPDQIATFDRLVSSFPGVGEIRQVPSLRGRIVKLNGVPVEQAVVAPDAQWAIGSDRGLTYSGKMPPGTRLVAGEWWPENYSGPPLVSMDGQIARGMGLGLGDTITINVLGREMEARIANLRAIDWTSLGINFTLTFAPGMLEGAPQTWIATAQVDPAGEDGLERAVTAAFPNVSSIRIKRALATARDTVEAIALAARATAAVTLAAGTLVLAGAILATQRRRTYDAVMLKVLGATRRDVMRALLLEFALTGAAAASVAAVLGTLAAYLLISNYMRIDFALLPGTLATTIAGAAAAAAAIGLAGTWRALGQKAAPLLRNA
ncbi:MAG: FtsX-like permease family protein [Alphaproteobacteria bacterium]|nr:FtsX-like permease family protein [Alphaproteobacteria bacterium]